jgi:hypothetical protein
MPPAVRMLSRTMVKTMKLKRPGGRFIILGWLVNGWCLRSNEKGLIAVKFLGWGGGLHNNRIIRPRAQTRRPAVRIPVKRAVELPRGVIRVSQIQGSQTAPLSTLFVLLAEREMGVEFPDTRPAHTPTSIDALHATAATSGFRRTGPNTRTYQVAGSGRREDRPGQLLQGVCGWGT